jgi:hypothetical protein
MNSNIFLFKDKIKNSYIFLCNLLTKKNFNYLIKLYISNVGFTFKFFFSYVKQISNNLKKTF